MVKDYGLLTLLINFFCTCIETDYPKGHNQYIENALETVFEPVLEGVGNLKQSVQLGVISNAIEAICQAWMSIILNEKIKFRYTFLCW